jgi:glycosyltransferase involved in cell wall biosynthesis
LAYQGRNYAINRQNRVDTFMENRTANKSLSPAITVVICTHNRAELLQKAIQSLVDQDCAQDEFEVLVVDNGSTDNTREVVERFSVVGNIRYLAEPEIGLCIARNTGWRNARGEYVAYLDDDAIAAPCWIASIARAFSRHSNAGTVGGRVEPIWEDARPDWLSNELALGLTIVDWSEHERIIPDINCEWLVGANMAMPKSVLDKVGGFHPKLDRVGKNMLSGGDVFLQKQIMELGYDCVYVPQMAVRHLVMKSRLDQNWFRRRYYWQGFSDGVMRLIENDFTPLERLGMALRAAGKLIFSPDKLFCLLFSTQNPARFTTKCFALIQVGQIAALLGATSS